MDYCITVRAPSGAAYTDQPGPTAFLGVPPEADDFATSQAIGTADWVRGVLGQLESKRDATGVTRKDLLVFIHGFDNLPPIVLQRHRRLLSDLRDANYRGGVVSFDWPSGDVALAYLDDRQKAKDTALALVRDCVELFARTQAGADCEVNVHLLAHSTGAYVVREAFDDADDRRMLASLNWTVSQIVFIGADISAASMTDGNPDTSSIFGHCVRLTNYANPFDEVLQLSNVKRAGVAPRVGRVGLPPQAPPKAVNVGCGEHYRAALATRPSDSYIGIQSHSWHIGDPLFAEDLARTLAGDLDRHAFATRRPLPTGQFELIDPTGEVASAVATPVQVAPSGAQSGGGSG